MEFKDGEVYSITEFGSTFAEVHLEFTNYVMSKFAEESFNGFKHKWTNVQDFEKIGLNPDEWLSDELNFKVNFFMTDRVRISAKEGYKLTYKTLDGELKELEEGKNIVFRFEVKIQEVGVLRFMVVKKLTLILSN